MNFFEKIKSLFGLGGVILADATGAAITAEKEAEFTNSLEFRDLLEGEFGAIAATQASTIAAQKTDLTDTQAQLAALVTKVEALDAKLQVVLVDVANAQSNTIKAEARIKELATTLNAQLGTPLVKQVESDANAQMLTGAPTAEEVVTINKYFKKVGGGI
jgi:hypothetical protein